MSSTIEVARLVGGPKSLASVAIPAGRAKITIERTVVYERLPCGRQPPSTVVLGVYRRIALVSPTVFMWEWWR